MVGGWAGVCLHGAIQQLNQGQANTHPQGIHPARSLRIIQTISCGSTLVTVCVLCIQDGTTVEKEDNFFWIIVTMR